MLVNISMLQPYKKYVIKIKTYAKMPKNCLEGSKA